MRKLLCRILIVLMAWTPYQLASAAAIGTEQALAPAAAESRGAVLAMLARADVACGLQLLGVDPAQARERVNAMSDEEANMLAGRLLSLPAGADATTMLLLVLLAGVLITWWTMR